MRALIQKLTVPASESQMGIALAISIAMMSFLLWGLLWQSSVITHQREIIRWMASLHGHVG